MSEAELSSVSTALADLSRRVASIADVWNTAKRENEAAALYEVERALASASRRLDRVLEGKLR